MAMPIRVQEDGFNYTKYIDEFDLIAKEEAESIFQRYQKRGVIKNDSFDDDLWVMCDEVRTVGIRFGYDQDTLKFEGICRNRLGITLKQYQLAIKLFITGKYGLHLSSIATIVRSCKQLLLYATDEITLSELTSYTQYLKEFINFVPSCTSHWASICDNVEILESTSVNQKQRKLGDYVSYLRFDKLLSDFWLTATENEKTLFFPVFLWWKLTAILPLRPTEFTLTPRQCLEKKDGNWYIFVRRTRLKGEQAATYSISEDFEQLQYQITEALAIEIEHYIRKTEQSCSSDIETLFCQRYQYEAAKMVKSTNYSHYMYSNLASCLEYFYKAAVPKSKYTLVDKIPPMSGRTLADNEIERMHLGDTRHIALINLIYSGGSPTICKELARHNSVDISSHYYSNISTFVEAVAFETFGVPQDFPPDSMAVTPIKLIENNGYCSSKGVKSGDYTDCMSVMDPNGQFLNCQFCKYNTRSEKKVFHTNLGGLTTDNEKNLLNNSVNELISAINLIRAGMGFERDIQSKILQLQAASNHYLERLKHGR